MIHNSTCGEHSSFCSQGLRVIWSTSALIHWDERPNMRCSERGEHNLLKLQVSDSAWFFTKCSEVRGKWVGRLSKTSLSGKTAGLSPRIVAKSSGSSAEGENYMIPGCYLGREMWTGESLDAAQQIVTALSVVIIVFLIKAWWNWQTAGRGFRPIPSKGSLGWPIIGETLSVAQCAGDLTFERWLRERLQKYGTMFKSHLFLKPWIVMTTPEEMKFVMDDPHKQMITGTPPSMKRVFGTTSVFVLEGKEHMDVYKLLNDSVSMTALKPKTTEFNRLMRHYMSSWDGQTVELSGAMEHIIFKIMTLNFFGIPWESEIADRVTALLLVMIPGITCLPIYFPGTIFYKAINNEDILRPKVEIQFKVTVRQCTKLILGNIWNILAGTNARRELDEILLPIIRELRSAKSGGSSKYASSAAESLAYQSLLDHELHGEKISDKTACDILLSPVLAGGQGPGHIAALAIYYLTKHPSMLQKARAEVDQLRTRKEKLGETDLSVSDLKDLKYLTQVYHEVLRMSPIVSGTGRVATTDIEFNGHVIPKGWFMLAPFVLVHMDPEIYPDPSKFNPDRFETPPNPGQFFPFGRGYRTCVGRNFTKLTALMALYHIFSNFTWDLVSCSGTFKFFPFLKMIGGYNYSIKARTDLT